MAFLPSDWGYDDATLVDPSPATNWSASPFAYVTVTLQAPSPPNTQPIVPSPWAFKQITMRNPHKPHGVMVAGGIIKYHQPLAWNGTNWR